MSTANHQNVAVWSVSASLTSSIITKLAEILTTPHCHNIMYEYIASYPPFKDSFIAGLVLIAIIVHVIGPARTAASLLLLSYVQSDSSSAHHYQSVCVQLRE